MVLVSAGIIDDSATSVIVGSKVITDRYSLYTGQTNYMYRTAKIVRNKGVVVPIRKMMVIMDYFTHGAGGDYFAGQSYQNIDYTDIPFYEGQYLSDSWTSVLVFQTFTTMVLER